MTTTRVEIFQQSAAPHRGWKWRGGVRDRSDPLAWIRTGTTPFHHRTDEARVWVPLVVVGVILWDSGLEEHRRVFSITPQQVRRCTVVKISGVATIQPGKFLRSMCISSLFVVAAVLTHFHLPCRSCPPMNLSIRRSTTKLNARVSRMSDAKQAAEVASFSRRRLAVPGDTTGTVVTGVVSPSPASHAVWWRRSDTASDHSHRLHCQLISTLHDVRRDRGDPHLDR